MQLSPELKALLRMKKPEFVDYMCANSTKKELGILYKLLFYRNINIDDAEQMIVDTFSKEELSENIYRGAGIHDNDRDWHFANTNHM